MTSFSQIRYEGSKSWHELPVITSRKRIRFHSDPGLGASRPPSPESPQSQVSKQLRNPFPARHTGVGAYIHDCSDPQADILFQLAGPVRRRAAGLPCLSQGSAVPSDARRQVALNPNLESSHLECWLDSINHNVTGVTHGLFWADTTAPQTATSASLRVEMPPTM
jgi:hypothetical protein